jgi:hypothetical protein
VTLITRAVHQGGSRPEEGLFLPSFTDPKLALPPTLPPSLPPFLPPSLPPSLPPAGDYYDRFVSKTLRNSTITVALMVPDPSGKTDMVRQVCPPSRPPSRNPFRPPARPFPSLSSPDC